MALNKKKRQNDNGCCSIGFLKCALHCFTFLFFAAGCLVLSAAIWTLLDRYQYVALLTSITYPILIYFLIAAGTLVVLVTVLGFCSIARENRIGLLWYIFLLLLIFLMEAMVGILAFVYREQVHNELEMNLKTTFVNYYGYDDDKTAAIDFLQEKFNCCGVTTYADWNATKWRLEGLSKDNLLVPDSCCYSIRLNCGKRTHPSNIHYTGCLENMEDHLKIHLGILSAVGLGICILQIFGIVYGCILYCKLRPNIARIQDKTRQNSNSENQNLFISTST